MFDPTIITGFINNLMTPEILQVSVLTFFTCYAIFKAFEPQDDGGRWADRYKVFTSLVVGGVWGFIVLYPTLGFPMALVMGVLAGGATTVTVDQFKH